MKRQINHQYIKELAAAAVATATSACVNNSLFIQTNGNEQSTDHALCQCISHARKIYLLFSSFARIRCDYFQCQCKDGEVHAVIVIVVPCRTLDDAPSIFLIRSSGAHHFYTVVSVVCRFGFLFRVFFFVISSSRSLSAFPFMSFTNECVCARVFLYVMVISFYLLEFAIGFTDNGNGRRRWWRRRRRRWRHQYKDIPAHKNKIKKKKNEIGQRTDFAFKSLQTRMLAVTI